jgi:hypothetical protein
MRIRIIGLLAAVVLAVPTAALAVPISYSSVLTSTNGTSNGILTFNYDAAIDQLDSLTVAFADGVSRTRALVTSQFDAGVLFRVLTDTFGGGGAGYQSYFNVPPPDWFNFFAGPGVGPNTYEVDIVNGRSYAGLFSAAVRVETTPVPEPGSLALLLTAMAGIALAGRRRSLTSSSRSCRT